MGAQIVKYNLLILGASNGSLFSTKLLLAGHLRTEKRRLPASAAATRD